MRVTDNNNFGIVRESIRRSKGRMDGLQQQAATLRKVNTPSDDPVGAAKVLEIRTDKVNNEQFAANARLAQAFLENSEQALSELSEIVARAKEIALGQSSGASSNDDTRIGVAEEVTQLFQQAVAAGNRRIGDRYLFGGYKTNKPPVDPDGRYLGDSGQMMIEVSKDVYISMNVPGHEIFNSNHQPESLETSEFSRENVNVFDQLQNFRIALLTGDLGGIRDSLDRFDEAHRTLIANRAKIGARLHGLSDTIQALDRHNVTNAQLSSSLEDADMAQVVSDLAKEETVFRSALQSSQKLIQPTLIDFLK